MIELIYSKRAQDYNEYQKSRRTKDVLTNFVDVGSEGLYNFDISTLRTTNWSCLPLFPCAPRSAHALPSPVTYQNGACFKKYNYHLFSLRVSDKTTSLRSWVYTFMHSCDSNCQLKRRVSSQFTSSLFPLHFRHLSNSSFHDQMHLQIEKLIITVPFRMYYLHDLFYHRSTCFCYSLC